MKKKFLAVRLAEIQKVIPYDSSWTGVFGYMDAAVFAVILKPGEVAKSIDNHQRNIIFVGTRFGTCVFFERHTPSENFSPIIVFNSPMRLRSLLTAGSLNVDLLDSYTNPNGHNIGTIVETLFSTEARYVDGDLLYAEAVRKAQAAQTETNA